MRTYDRGLDEPPRVANRVEESKSFLHTVLKLPVREGKYKHSKTYHALILVQHLIILAQTDQEHQSRYVFKAVNPLLTFTALTSNVKQSVRQLANFECRLRDTSRLHSTPKYILIGWRVTRWWHAINSIEVIDRRVIELKFSRPPDSLLDSGITPNRPNRIGHVIR